MLVLALILYFEFHLLIFLLIYNFSILKAEINLVLTFCSTKSKGAEKKKKHKSYILKNVQCIDKVRTYR